MAASKNSNILVVDHADSTTVAVSLVLKQAGHHVEVVKNGESACASIKGEPSRYDLVITDHRMKYDGLEVAKCLRKTEFAGKILVLSGSLTPEIEDAYRQLGVEAFISKPFDLAELRGTVSNLLQHGEDKSPP